MSDTPVDPGRTQEAYVLKGFVAGTLIGLLCVPLLWGGAAVLGGIEVMPSLGIAAFTAFWGGPGFGGMLGAVIGYERHRNDA